MIYIPFAVVLLSGLIMRLDGGTVSESIIVGLLAGILTAISFLVHQGEHKEETK